MYPQPLAEDQLVGEVIASYRVEQLLGHGKVNAVYMARQQGQQQPVMLTTFLLPQAFSPQARERFQQRFLQEGTQLARLRHPHILPVYDFGEYRGYPYLVTPLVTTGSLAKLLKQQSRLAPERALAILKQIAAGLDYAHSTGVVHGSLSSTNIMLDREQNVQIAGFGLEHILEMRGLEPLNYPYAHLMSIAQTFLGSPEHIAPEVVQGAPIDARADVYAVGAILFELLTGKPPFSGVDPLSTAIMHLQQPVPLLQTVSPDLSPALDFILQRALERNPAQRYPSAHALVEAFERVLRIIDTTGNAPVMEAQHLVKGAKDVPTLPPIAPQPSVPQQNAAQSEDLNAAEELAVDPFVWWSTTSLAAVQSSASATDVAAPGRLTGSISAPQQRVDKGRRRVTALLVTGSGVAVGILGVGGFGLAARLMREKNSKSAAGNAMNMQSMSASKTATPGSMQMQMGSPTPKASATQKAKPSPTPSPTSGSTPTPSRTGTVIGASNQGANSAKSFMNPADGAGSLLVRLSSGSFVAFESACTHEGVTVNYDAASQKLICPRHRAIFDPANNAQVLQGPAPKPLPPVSIRVNGDGTVTTG